MMNAVAILTYGQRAILDSVAALTEAQWDTPGVCGVWSAREVIAHLTSYEWVLLDALTEVVGGGPTPHLDTFRQAGPTFNQAQVEARRDQSATDAVAELTAAHTQALDALLRVPAATLRQPGTLPWYGAEYAVDDLIVYTAYGHKREHSAQIAVYRDRLAR